MTEVSQALNGAELVKVKEVQAWDVVQVWHGGTTVNVYVVCKSDEKVLEEDTCWNLSDEKGRPVSEGEIAEHMDNWFGILEEEWSAEVNR